MILSTTLVLGATMTVGFVGSSVTQREAWSVQYAAPEPVAGAAFGVRPAAYEPPSEDVQLDRVVRMLDQSDAVLGADSAVSEPVLRARSELGMLLATYQAQQAVARGETPGAAQGPAADGPGDPLGLPAAPAAPAPLDPVVPVAPPTDVAAQTPPVVAPPGAPSGAAPSVVPGAPAAPAGPATGAAPLSPTPPELGTGAADVLATDPDPGLPPGAIDPGPSGGAGAPGSPAGAADPSLPAGAVPDGVDPETGLPSDVVPPVAPGPADGDAPVDGETPAHDDLVTIDDVVAAATQLAELMGPAYALAAVGVVPAEGVVPEDGTLADQLAAAVARYADSTAQYANGMLPDSVLCPLTFAPGHSLRCDAAEQLDALAVEYQKQFGKPLRITDSYRSYDAQVAVKAAKPFLAAVPGTSQHGWGLAIDLGSPVSTGTSAEYLWMRLHAPDYGWDNPTWARPDGRKPEPWHFEFYAAGALPDRYTPGTPATPTTPPTEPTTPTTPPATPPPTAPAPTPSPTTPVPTDPPTPTPTPTTPTPTPTEPAPTTPTEPTPSPTEPTPTPTTPAPTPTEPAPTPTTAPTTTAPAPAATLAPPLTSPTNLPSFDQEP